MLPQRTKPFKHDYLAIMAKYPPGTRLAFIAELEGINLNTLKKNVWRFDLQPRQRKPRRHGMKEGRHGMKEGRREALMIVLKAVNIVRLQDLTGPEACGAITDTILDALDALGG